MSLFSWFSPAKKPVKAAAAPAAAPVSSGLSRMESTKPYPRGGADEAHGQPANRKSERMARRELLYGVVRESMTNAGILSASYKFKVLSLDARGAQFLVMVDLSREYGSGTSSLAEVEAMIAQSAKARYDIMVTAVYWRMNEHVALGINAARAQARQAAPRAQPTAEAESRPVTLHSGPAPLHAVPAASAARAGARYEPIQGDEVEAFKRALAEGTPGAAGAPPSYTLLAGEDAEMADEARQPNALSGTQYGDLR